MENELGYLKGEICNRNGCNGIIDEHEKEGSCSCHINPPCSTCTDASEYCPECEWDGREDQIKRQQEHAEKWKPSEAAQQAYNRLMDAEEKRRKDFWSKYHSNEPIEKYEAIYEGHTHFSMKKIGVFPPCMTRKEVEEKVKGTFGGRFTRFSDGRFEYIAYTD